MGRQEPLTVAALGRSPYDFRNWPGYPNTNSRGGQQYDPQGRPINPASREAQKDFIKACNEVMVAAGIVESSVDVRARDQAAREQYTRENKYGLELVDIGRLALLAGVWGVNGLRNRILLYHSYSYMSMPAIIRSEVSRHSKLWLFFVGTPALAASQALEWARFQLNRRIRAWTGEDDGLSHNSQKALASKETSSSQVLLSFGVGYIRLHLEMFALLQQLDLISSGHFPSLSSFVPWTTYSPIQIPSPPLSFTPTALSRWASEAMTLAAPWLLYLAYTRAHSVCSNFIWFNMYEFLPVPINSTPPARRSVAGASGQHSRQSSDDNPAADVENIDPLRTEDPDTLRALEGFPPQPFEGSNETARSADASQTQPVNDDQSDGSASPSSTPPISPELQHTTMISFDVDTSDLPPLTPGGTNPSNNPLDQSTAFQDSTQGAGNSSNGANAWSAELRSASDIQEYLQSSRTKLYRSSAFTLLPSILAAEVFGNVLAHIVLYPLEILLVRTVGRSFRANKAMFGTMVGLSAGSANWGASNTGPFSSMSVVRPLMLVTRTLNMWTVDSLEMIVTVAAWMVMMPLLRGWSRVEMDEDGNALVVARQDWRSLWKSLVSSWRSLVPRSTMWIVSQASSLRRSDQIVDDDPVDRA